MSGSRFVLLSRRVAVDTRDSDAWQGDAWVGGGSATEALTWMLVSPNSRPLGRAVRWFGDVDDCRADIGSLREHREHLSIAVSVTGGGGQWSWRADFQGVPAAVSSRTYLRQHESDYNVRRFLEAVPNAELATTIRLVGGSHK